MIEALLLSTLMLASGQTAAATTDQEPATESQMVQPEEEPIKLERLSIDLRALDRITEMAPNIDAEDGLMMRIINDRIRDLREPRADGSYQWASLKREEASRDTKEEKIQRVYTEKESDTITFDGREGYRVEVEAPRKKSLFSANVKIFVKSIIISGESGDREVPVSVWVDPGTTWGGPLPEILGSQQVKVLLGVETGREDGVAKVSLLRAKLVDDARSPYYPAVTKLLLIRDRLAGPTDRAGLERAIDEALATVPGEVEKTLRLERERAEERVRMLEEGEVKGSVEPGDATPDVVLVLQEIDKRLSGNLEEQEAGRAALDDLIEKLVPDTLNPPETTGRDD